MCYKLRANVLKSLVEKPQISDWHVLGLRSFDILLLNLRTFYANFFAFRMYGELGNRSCLMGVSSVEHLALVALHLSVTE